jgi:hypothetical protein
VPAGNHTIFVDNQGTDWITISSYVFGNYVAGIRSYCLQGTNTTMGWVENRNYNWQYVLNSGPPAGINDGTITMTGLANNGIYKINWYECVSGTAQSNTTGTASGGSITFSVPAISWDLAYKLTYQGPAANTPTPTYSQTLTATITRTPVPGQTLSATITATVTPTITPGQEKQMNVNEYPDPLNPVTMPEMYFKYNNAENEPDNINVRIYTAGFRLIKEYLFGHEQAQQIAQQGVIMCPTDGLRNLSNGMYFYVILATENGKPAKSKTGEFIIIK